MKKMPLSACLVAIILSAGATVLPVTPVFAQSGSRICGYSTAKSPSGPLGFLTEVRQAETSYSLICDGVVRDAKEKIDRDPTLKNLTWVKHYKETCEAVGTLFVSSNSPQDMCDKMQNNEDYMVQKNSDNTTRYDRLSDQR
jgi:hypothetical protein